MYYIVEGGIPQLYSECFPTSQCFRDGIWGSCYNGLNIGGLVNFVGLIGTIAAVVLGAFSMERVRRKMYDNFYIVHVITALIFVIFAVLHDFDSMILAFAGLGFYMQDRWTAVRSRSSHSEVTAEVACNSSSSSIVVLTWNASAQPPQPTRPEKY